MNQNYKHPKRKTKVVFVQLGSPSEPTTKALRKYLKKFLGEQIAINENRVWVADRFIQISLEGEAEDLLRPPALLIYCIH